jgi:hypothetical protein
MVVAIVKAKKLSKERSEKTKRVSFVAYIT